MLAKNCFFILLFIINCSFIYSMERFPPNRIKFVKISDNESSKQQESYQETSYLEVLPEELAQKILVYFMRTGGNLKKAIENFQTLSIALSKIRGTNYIVKNFTEQHVSLFAKWLKINPFFVARKLKVKLSNKLKEELKKQAIKDEAEKNKISYKELNNWLRRNKIDIEMLTQTQRIWVMKRVFDPLCQKGKSGIMGILALLDGGINPDFRDNVYYGLRPLNEAIEAHNKEVVSVLLNCGANPDGDNSFILGRNYICTPLMEAVSSENKDIVSLLLNAGADPNSMNSNFETALSIAKNQNSNEIADLLKENGAKIYLLGLGQYLRKI